MQLPALDEFERVEGADRQAVATKSTASGVTAVCASLGKALAVPEPALGVAGRDGA
jgi:hypothetical protein